MEKTRTVFQAIGTRWEIQIPADLGESPRWQVLLERIHQRIQAFDKAYSRFRKDSLVTEMSQRAGTYRMPPDSFRMLAFYEQLYRATQGKVTPLIGRTMVEAGYDADYSLQPQALHTPPRWEEVLSYSAHEVTVKQPVLLDFGAAGKGYLVDIISDMVKGASVADFTINAGGDILHYSNDNVPQEVGLENPFNTAEVIGVMRLANQSLCASSGSKRAWGNYHHIIDPEVLESPTEVVATWALAEDTMTADGLATALFFTEPEALKEDFSFSYALMDAQGGLRRANNFPVTLFEAE